MMSINMAALMYNVSRGFAVLREHSLLLRGHNQFLLDSRRYVRALRRRPVTVLYPDGERETRIKSNESANKINQKYLKQGREGADKSDGKFTNMKITREVDIKKRTNLRYVHGDEYTKDKLGGLRYEKAPAGDKRLG